MTKFIAIVMALMFAPISAFADALTRPPVTMPAPIETDRTRLTDEKIVALLIAASVAAYLAMNRPCACPYHSDRAGRSCGGRSAHSRPGGFSPLCFPTDVTAGMIASYRKSGSVAGR